jgi:hypothetical protein
MPYFLIILMLPSILSRAQMQMPAYTLRQDSLTHTTVIHIDGAQLRRIKMDADTGALLMIAPEIKIKNGIVDHKGLTGELYVRAHYFDSVLIGYVEYDGTNMKREIYYNPAGNVFLEKRYKGNDLIYTNDKVQVIIKPKPITHANTK